MATCRTAVLGQSSMPRLDHQRKVCRRRQREENDESSVERGTKTPLRHKEARKTHHRGTEFSEKTLILLLSALSASVVNLSSFWL